MNSEPPIFYTPDDEPYLGIGFLQFFDETLSAATQDLTTLSVLTRANDLSALEIAVVDLVPTSMSIAFSIRELIRQAYIPGARILLTPLLERAATVDFIVNEPTGIDLWVNDWTYGRRPGFAALMARMTNVGDEDFEFIRAIADDFNSVIHAEPEGSRKFIFHHPEHGRPLYSLSRTYGAEEMVGNIASASAMAVTFLASNAKRTFAPRIAKLDD